MPIAAFKPPGVYKNASFAQEEWIVFNDANGSRLRYWKINANGASFTALTDIAQLSAGAAFPIATNGTFVFCASNIAAGVVQYAWNGSTLTSRLSAAPGSPVTNGPVNDYLYLPGAGNVLRMAGAGDFQAGVQSTLFQTAPTYTFGTPTSFAPVNLAWYRMIDLRVGAVGQPVYGSTGLVASVNAGQRMDAFTASGTTITSAANLTVAGAASIKMGCDRDSGLIVMGGSTANLVYMIQMNMTSRALSAIGNGTITGATLFAVTACNGFVITYETSGNVRSYSRSGSTLTLVSTSALGGSPSRGILHVSPYTNYVYLLSDVSGHSRIYSVNPTTGALTTLCVLTGALFPVTGTYVQQIGFLPAALPTV